MPDLVIRSRRVVTGDSVGPACVQILNGIITAVSAYDELPPGYAVADTGDSVVMPGLMDTHVHVNEPGRTDWEGFRSATRSAAAGGVTTLLDMPLNSVPPTTTGEGLRAKLEAAQGQCWVDVGFWGGVVPGNFAELRRLFDAGVFGFKCFLVPSGVEEFPNVAEPQLRAALEELAALGSVLLVHAESPGAIEKAAGQNASPRRYAAWLRSRPAEAENEAITLLIRLSRELGAKAHVVHLSSSDSLPALRRAKDDGVPVTVETCPHYLCFAAEDIPDGATEFKCAPPVRERANRERLWSALREGTIDLIASDHSPCPPELKRGDGGDFLRAWGGIASLQLSLSAVWTEAQRRGCAILCLVEWMSRGPARLAGLDHRKGAIATGYDADLVVWNPEAAFSVEPAKIHHRHSLTPYAGQVLSGVVEQTYLRGEKIYDRGDFSSGPRGAILKREK